MDELTPTLLINVPTAAEVLHQPCETVSFPLSEDDKQLIANMLYSIQPPQLKAAEAAWESAAGMAANQWGFNKRIFLFGPGRSNTFQVKINPSYTPVEEAGFDELWEGCFSLPLTTGLVRRWLKIIVEYDNIHGEHFVEELEGWEARVWQHENDHLNGHLYNSVQLKKCLEIHSFPTREGVLAFRSEPK